MNRIAAVGMSGLYITAACLFLLLRADSLATDWEPSATGSGWGGLTDPNLRHTYQTIGYLGIGFGFVLMGLSAYQWLVSAERQSARWQ